MFIETEKPSESANLPQWAAKTDADISELKNQKNITYEMYTIETKCSIALF